MTSASDRPGTPLGLFGRANELEALGELISSARAGRGVSVLIEGEPGIGKTALLDAVSALCHDAGFGVVRGTVEELEQRVPLRAVRSLLSALTAPGHSSVARALLFRDADEPLPAIGFTEHIQCLLDGWCEESPVALLLDDLQWADPYSVEVLERVQRSAAGRLPLLMCMTVQTLAPSAGLASPLQVIQSVADRRLVLGPLAGEDVARLTSSLLGARPGPRLQERIAAAAGNALFVTELVSALQIQGHLGILDGTADLSIGAAEVPMLPASVNETILQRMDFLSHEARDVLEVCAVMGPRVHLADLATVLGAPVMKVWQQVREAVGVGLLVEVEDRLSFRHNIVRQSLLDVMPRSVWAALHQQAGRMLAAADAPPEQVARHLALADVSLGQEVLDWLSRAASRLVSRSPEDAVELLERAAAEARGDDPRYSVFSLELTQVLLQINDTGRAESAARNALATVGDDATKATLHRLMAWSIFKKGDLQRALEEAGKALELWPSDARLHAFVSLCCFMLGALSQAENAAKTALAVAPDGDHYIPVYGHAALAMLRVREMRSGAALEHCDAALALLGHQTVDPDLPMDPRYIRGVALMDLDRCSESESAFALGLAACEDGAGVFVTAFHVGRAWLFFQSGRWDDAMVEIRAGQETVDHLRMHSTLILQAALIARHRGDLGSVSAGSYPHMDSSAHTFHQDWVRALSMEANGNSEGGLKLLFDAWERGLAEKFPRALYDLFPDAARLAAEIGDKDRLHSLYQALADTIPAMSQTTNARALQLLCKGLLEDNARLLLEAADLFRSSQRVLHGAYASERAVVVLAQQGCTDSARKALNHTLITYGELGAAWDAARAERIFAAVGLRWRRRNSWRTQSGWASLTDTEQLIAFHVAEGCSNPDIAIRLFLSPRTIQFHLANIFGKLGIGSRVELAVHASQRKTQSAPETDRSLALPEARYMDDAEELVPRGTALPRF
ncbi:AAA family ATPase [Streptomyces collinus]|uniref:helix-turn-helix transcriptional regulator n=1 Tax=Streptomyces collinus TaxID=42684 RepID=UPI0036CADAA2